MVSPELERRLSNNPQDGRRKVFFLLAIIGLILAGAIRSALATHLDSLDIDEAYHVTAGVTYLRLGDYRLNPEHPPLVKLWAAAFLPEAFFHLPPLHPLADKIEERNFAASTVYSENDPDAVQRRVRFAMLLLNGMLVLVFALAVWRVFHPTLAIGAVAFLMIDPTVAAHMPMVLTDLPVALLASTAVLLAFFAFQTWKPRDLVLTGVVLGLTFGAKHSAPVVVAAVAFLGVLMALRQKGARRDRMRHLVWVVAVLVVAWSVLWGLYGFRFNESGAGRDLFNRPLADKIADVNSPTLRRTVSLMSELHALPRAYLWGLADIIRAGVEGRLYPIYFWNHYYIRKTPFYFFPALIFFKLPVGLMVLCAVGFALLASGRAPPEWRAGLGVMIGLAGIMLGMLAVGNSSYAGVRHALPVFPTLAILGGVTVFQALQTGSRVVQVVAVLGLALASISAIPVLRPWEYFNELAGGHANGYHHFNGEGVDSGQRVKELAEYYHKQLEPKGIIPYVNYWFFFNDEEFKKRGVRTLQMQWDQDESTDTSEVISGTLMINANLLTPDPWFDYTALRSARPAERIGNLLIYRGTFALPRQRAGRLTIRAILAIYNEKPDLPKAERLLREAVALAPQIYFANIELGNLLAQRGAREEAIRAYESAETYAPTGEAIVGLLSRQVERIAHEDPKSVPPVRDPWLE